MHRGAVNELLDLYHAAWFRGFVVGGLSVWFGSVVGMVLFGCGG